MTVPLYNLTDTWIANGSDAILMSVTSGGFTGNALRLRMDAADLFRVDKTGNVYLLAGGLVQASNTALSLNAAANVSVSGGGAVSLSGNFGNSTLSVGSGIVLTAPTFTVDLRGGASQPHALNIFNTYTDASNYEKGVFDWTSTANTLTIGMVAAGTGAGRAMVIGSGATSTINMTAGDASSRVFVSNNSVMVNSASSISLGPAFGTVVVAMDGSANLGLYPGTGYISFGTNQVATTGSTWRAAANSPATLASGTTNNYSFGASNAGGRSYFQRLTANASNSVLTGVSIAGSAAQVDGEVHLIVNLGTGTLTLNHQDAGSTAGNQFFNSTAAAIVLSTNQAADMIYDATTARWRVYKRN